MLSLSLRRYARPPEQVSGAEMALGLFILVLTGGIVTAFIYEVTRDRRDASEAAESSYETPPGIAGDASGSAGTAKPGAAEPTFPDAGVPGWQSPQRVFHYGRDDLYVKINGRATVYLEAGVVGLAFGTYSSGSDPRRSVDVYWYDMGTPARASAIYRAEAPPAAKQGAIGDESCEVGGAVFFRAGASYVQVLPGGLVEGDGQAALSIAERVAARIGRGAQAGSEGESGE